MTTQSVRPPFTGGLYGITPDWHDKHRLEDAIRAAACGGMTIVQLRLKTASLDTQITLIHHLAPICLQMGVYLIVNDQWQILQSIGLNPSLGLSGVHIGRDDGLSQTVRQVIGESYLLGVSCYDDLDRAIHAYEPLSAQTDLATVDYVAFGAMFSSTTKPHAPPAALSTLTRAREHWQHQKTRPVLVAIGGITPNNAKIVVDAGADSLAVSAGLFESPDIEQTARQLSQWFHLEKKSGVST